jgi:hypothetical protein
MSQKYKAIARPLSDEDKLFVKLVSEGKMNRSKAFRTAYPNHPHSLNYREAFKSADATARKRAAMLSVQASKTKLQTKRIQTAMEKFQDRMDTIADKSLNVIDTILDHGRSEKVRADLAVEMVRHKVGTPTHKIAKSEEKVVYFGFGKPPKERDTEEIIEAEIIEESDEVLRDHTQSQT